MSNGVAGEIVSKLPSNPPEPTFKRYRYNKMELNGMLAFGQKQVVEILRLAHFRNIATFCFTFVTRFGIE